MKTTNLSHRKAVLGLGGLGLGILAFHDGAVKVPSTPGLGVEIDQAQLARLHRQYLDCGVRNGNDLAQMRKYDPAFSGACPRF